SRLARAAARRTPAGGRRAPQCRSRRSLRGGSMPDSDLLFLPATELARMVRAGEISATELVQTALERIEELNPALNAFVEIDAEGALAAAAAIGPGDERPFA